MKSRLFVMLLCVLVVASLTTYGQMIKRTDAVWARTTSVPITLDGKLTEAAWATADSVRVQMGKDNGIPGSGWYWENGASATKYNPLDPTDATIKFLARGDSLYVAIVCRDKSIGAGLFNQFDGLLMNLRYRGATGYLGNPYKNRTNQANEFFYGWVSETWADPNTAAAGARPGFFGDFPSLSTDTRPDSLKAYWDAATFVRGTVNDDSGAPDTSWTTEFKFNVNRFNYNITQPAGDIVMWSVSIYDADYRWPVDSLKYTGNRAWFQSPWGNGSNFNHVRIFARPDVTTESGPLPVIGADYTIPDGRNYATPVIDGKLNDQVWKSAPSLRIKFGDGTIRNAYANTAKYRSGQFQPPVNGATNAVIDPNLATVKFFFKADTLYLGFDVTDRFVQAVNDYDRWDGFRVTMDQRDARNGDSTLAKRRLTFRVDSAGAIKREEDLSLSGWDSLKTAVQAALSMNSGTVVDTAGTVPDSGYTAEMKIILPKFGYAPGRGDGVVFLGITEFDGDSFSGGSYGTRTWFMREGDGDDGAAWFYMDPTAVVTDVADAGQGLPADFALLGNYPNPFNPSTSIRFQMAQQSEVRLKVYDVIGRLVSEQSLGVCAPGQHAARFDASSLASGTYFYRLQMVSDNATLVGKMMLLK